MTHVVDDWLKSQQSVPDVEVEVVYKESCSLLMDAVQVAGHNQRVTEMFLWYNDDNNKDEVEEDEEEEEDEE